MNIKHALKFDFDDEGKEFYCIKCNQVYFSRFDLFREIIDYITLINITNLMCSECIKSFRKCKKCERSFDEPYDKVFWNLQTKEYVCICCFNHPKNIHYKYCRISYCPHCSSFGDCKKTAYL